MQYQFIMMHIPGVKHKIPDTLSHYPVSHDILAPNKNSSNAEEAAYTFALTSRNNFQTVTWEKVKIATQSDESMPRLLSTIEHGFPTSKQDLSKEKQEYHQYWDGMSFTALVVLRTALSYHHCYGRTYLISCTLPIRVLAPCSQEQWKLFFG